MSGKTLTVTKLTGGGCVQLPVTGSVTYGNEGKPTGTTYPEFIGGVTPPSATYGYDNISRLIGVTDNNELDVTACAGSGTGSITWASGGTYNPAGQLTAVSRLQAVAGRSPAAPNYTNQGWKYNNLNQVTEIDMARTPS